ncbi:hypothetical protein JHL17_28185 [Azospirillum sp. YIM B02556]|uniref:Uncharacterized protein n=1 Tax=Azospirillum endophyticum TaxID=2800326 RepID=A0ABS1FCZ2_9PROT|nr:hypothetical protein [Azospirillum endophyticum]MBK1841290.1 hypothetical protein [Azospirillum endophyticum]
MDEREYEQLKRRHHDLMKRSREVVEEACRIRLDSKRRPTPANAWSSTTAKSRKTRGGKE